MNIYSYHYTYLIINLRPISQEKFYIGVHSSNTIPENDEEYMGSSSYLTEDINTYGKENFKKIILKSFPTRELAEKHEEYIHSRLNVASNGLYYNKRNANAQFTLTFESAKKIANTFNNKHWLSTRGNEMFKRQKKTRASEKYKKSIMMTCEHCNKTVDKGNYIRWHGNNCGVINADAIIKQKKTKQSDEYKQKHYRTCDCCGKYVDKGNYKRWHGENCKMKK
jgi:hypothetical protein